MIRAAALAVRPATERSEGDRLWSQPHQSVGAWGEVPRCSLPLVDDEMGPSQPTDPDYAAAAELWNGMSQEARQQLLMLALRMSELVSDAD